MLNQTLKITCWKCQKTYYVNVEKNAWEKYKAGIGLIQDTLKDLSAGERELIISRTCSACWEILFPPETP